MSTGIPVMAVEQVKAFIAQEGYNEKVQEGLDLTIKAAHGSIAVAAVRALGVFLLSPETRDLLASNDPKALIQALNSLGLSV
jgi:hypothetical protein